MGEVRAGAKLAIIGEAPGKREVEEARVFTGPSGVELEDGLRLGGLRRNETTIINVMGCQPDIEGGSLGDYLTWLGRENVRRQEAGKPAWMSPIEACRPRLLEDLRESDSDVWLAVGGRALEAVARMHGLNYGKGKDSVDAVTIATIGNQHGAPIEIPPEVSAASPVTPKKRIVATSLHPAFAMRGKRAYKYVIQEDIARGARIADRGYIDWSMPDDVTLYPTIEVVEEVCRVFVAHKTEVAVDIEGDSADTLTCNVRCVGIGGVWTSSATGTKLGSPTAS